MNDTADEQSHDLSVLAVPALALSFSFSVTSPRNGSAHLAMLVYPSGELQSELTRSTVLNTKVP